MKKILSTAASFAIITALCLFTGCKNNDHKIKDDDGTKPEGPRVLTYSIGPAYPHDTSSFTEGLLFYNGELYESTGLEGQSKLIQVDLKTGKAKKLVNLDAKWFGEGISIIRDTVYQLTYQTKDVLVYALKDLKKIDKQFKIGTEGWGMTTDGKELIASDGTSNLYYYRPTDFKLLRTQSVTEAGSLAYNLNELEYIDGFIYANQWQAPYILKIDPSSGAIVAKADLTDLWKKIQSKDPAADVPNGIAYDPATKKMYITGKKWPDMYEVEFSK